MPIHVMDFEGNRKCGVIEWGVVSLEGDQVVEARTDFCRPRQPIAPQDALLHGLRDERLADCRDFADYRSYFFELRRNGWLAAHHASVENGLLAHYWSVVSSGKSSGSNSVPGVTGDWGPWIDTRVLAERVWQPPSSRLTDLTMVLGLEKKLQQWAEQYCPSDRRQAHCALFDALASALLLLRIRTETGWAPAQLLQESQPTSRRSDAGQGELF